VTEFISIFAVFLGGCALLCAAGLRGWALPPLGLLAGACLQLDLDAIPAVATLPPVPALTIMLIVVLPVAWWTHRWRLGRDVRVRGSLALLTLAGLAIAIGVLPSVTPLLGLAALAALGWYFSLGGRDLLGPARLLLFGALGVALLAAADWYAVDLFHVDGHPLLAAQLLLVVGSGWLLARDHRVRALRLLQLVAVPAVILSAPEGLPVAILALLPTWLSATIPARHRAMTMLACGGTAVAWHASQVAVGERPQVLTVVAIALGAVVLVLIPIRRWPFPLKRAASVLRLVEGALWLTVLAIAVRDPGAGWRRLSAARASLSHGEARWAFALIVLGLLVAVALAGFPVRHQAFLRFPVTTVVALVLLLAYLPGTAPTDVADELSRLLTQYLPLAVLAMMVAYATSPSRGSLPESAASSSVAMATAGTGEPAR
jgi:hypothetical protein